jgi:hypothetical protein
MRAYFARRGTNRQARAAENLTTLQETGALGIGVSRQPIERTEACQEISLQTLQEFW